MIKVYTKVEDRGISEFQPASGASLEWGYGQYVNAYIIDTEWACPEIEGAEEMGMYATERVPFDADQERISKARKLARDRARQRYLREKANA